MLRRVLGGDRDKLTFTVLEDILRAGRPDAMAESEHLEFKSELPKDKLGRFKFARAIASLANASGGILVCGVQDDQDDRASKIVPVPLGGQIANLQRSLNQHLSPAPPFSFLRLEKDNGIGLLVVEVLPSSLGPHAVHVDSKPEFFIRRGLENVPMSEQELERAYRHRFVARGDSQAKISAAKAAAESACPAGAMWLASVPAMQSRRAYGGPRDGHDRFGQLVNNGRLYGPPGFRLGGSLCTTRARRIVCFEHHQNITNFCSLSDEGDFTAWFALGAMDDLHRDPNRSLSWMDQLHPAPSSYLGRRSLFGDLILLLVVLRDVWTHFDLWGRSEVALGICPGNAVFWYRHPSEGGGAELLTEPLELRWHLSLADLLTPGYVERLVGEAFEEVTAAFGLRLQQVVSGDGALVVAALGNVAPEWFRERNLRCV